MTISASDWAASLAATPDDRRRPPAIPATTERPDWARAPGPDAPAVDRLIALREGRIPWERT